MMHEIRQTVVLLVWRIVVLEILISVLSLGIRPLLDLLDWDDVTISWLSLYGALILLVRIINIILLLAIIVRWFNHKYVIDKDEIHEFSGVLRRSHARYGSLNLEKIHSEQSFWGRVFKYGDVAGYNPVLGKDIVLANIPKPGYYAQQLIDLKKVDLEGNSARSVNILRN